MNGWKFNGSPTSISLGWLINRNRTANCMYVLCQLLQKIYRFVLLLLLFSMLTDKSSAWPQVHSLILKLFFKAKGTWRKLISPGTQSLFLSFKLLGNLIFLYVTYKKSNISSITLLYKVSSLKGMLMDTAGWILTY